MANRLKKILPKLISPWKIAFVPGRKIQENRSRPQNNLYGEEEDRENMMDGLKVEYGKIIQLNGVLFPCKYDEGFGASREVD